MERSQDVDGENGRNAPRDAGNWAAPDRQFDITAVPEGAININLQGRQVLGAMQGFGQLWRKTYRLHLKGVRLTPEEVMAAWKANFEKFQPKENHFAVLPAGVRPGEVLFINTNLPVMPGSPGVVPMASGVKILYADEVSFTVMTPEGFPESGWNTFSTYEEDDHVVAQVQSMARASDPLYEFGVRVMGGSQKQEKTWAHVLTSVGKHFGVDAAVEMNRECLDPRMQWRFAKNIFRNAMFPTILYRLGTPFRWLGRKLRGQK